MKITLASASPRRRELIAKIKNLTAEIYPSGADESRISASTPQELAENLALVKAESVFRDCGGIVLGADTVVALGGRVLGKPKTEAEAREFLRLLSGKTHEVITGIAIINEEKTIVKSEITRVTFGLITDDAIDRYVATGSPMDKAGAYGLQDADVKAFTRCVDGDEDNVIGLPVRLVEKTLEENF